MNENSVEQECELRLRLIPGPECPPLTSQEFQQELQSFSKALQAEDIRAFTKNFSFDGVPGGGAGLSGEYMLMGVAIVQLRKLIEMIFKTLTGGTVIEVKKGNVTVKCSARDIQKILTPEQIDRLVESSSRTVVRKKTAGE